MTIKTEKLYIVADLQDLEDLQEKTLDEAKGFLAGMWEDLEQDDPYFDEIEKASYEELAEFLGGVDYVIFENMKEYREFSRDWNTPV